MQIKSFDYLKLSFVRGGARVLILSATFFSGNIFAQSGPLSTFPLQSPQLQGSLFECGDDSYEQIAKNAGNSPLIPNRSAPGLWEKFR
jgi:hypothetical protein